MYLLLVFVAAYGLAPARAAPQACRNCSSSATGPGTSARIIGHFVNWKSSVLQVAGIDGSLLTEIVYEQFDIVNGQCVVNDVWGDTQKQFGPNVLGDDTNASPYKGNFYQLRLLKQQPGNVGRLRTLIMIGGWSSSSNLSVIASTSAGRRLLASSCTGLARYYGFDGVDVGWQYPVRGGAPKNVYSASDKTNLPLLLAAFRSQDPGLLLTTTIRYQQDTLFPTYDLAAIANQVDWIHADTFGSWGTWSSSTGHYANLYYNLASPNTQTVDGMVQQALAAGVPPCKFILDVPLSFPAWTTSQSVAASFPALFTTGSGYSTGATDGGMFRYRDVVSIASGGSYQFVWDSISAASVLYSTSTLVWIATETMQSTAAKAAYVTSNNLGGVKFLDLSGDTSSFQIVTTMQSALKSAAPCSGQVAAVPLSGAIPGYQQQAPGACAPVTSSAGVPALRTATRVIGRFTNYKQSFLAVADIDGTLLTHVIYESAVANSSWQCDFESAWYDIQQVLGTNALGDDTNDPYHGNFNQLRRLKLKYPHLKTILQLGPDVLFSSLLSVPAHQSAFVSSCVAMMRQYGFDGLNIYWNNPVTGASYKSDPHLSTDRTQLPVVMQMFRAQMPPGALLTLTMTSMAYEMYAMYDVPGIVPYVDFIEYRNEWMWGTWSSSPAHLNPLHFNIASMSYASIDANIVQLLNWGMPHCKLVLGVPVYGEAWQLSGSISGPFYPGVFSASGSAYTTGSTDDSGHYRYRDVVALMQASPGSWADQWDPVSMVSFLYNSASRIVITYENPASITAKAAYVKSMTLGGFAVDNLDGDTTTFTLLQSAVQAMFVPKTTTQTRKPTQKPTVVKPKASSSKSATKIGGLMKPKTSSSRAPAMKAATSSRHQTRKPTRKSTKMKANTTPSKPRTTSARQQALRKSTIHSTRKPTRKSTTVNVNATPSNVPRTMSARKPTIHSTKAKAKATTATGSMQNTPLSLRRQTRKSTMLSTQTRVKTMTAKAGPFTTSVRHHTMRSPLRTAILSSPLPSSPSLPLVSVVGPTAGAVDTAQTLILTAVLSPAATAAFEFGRDFARWAVAGPAAPDLTDPSVVLTSLSSSELRIAPCALQPGGTYTFTVTLSLAGASTQAHATVTTGAGTSSGPLSITVTPSAGPIQSLVDVLSMSVTPPASPYCAVFFVMMHGMYPSALGNGACVGALQTVLPAGDPSNGHMLNITAVLITPRGQRTCRKASVSVAVIPPPSTVDLAGLVSQRVSSGLSSADVALAAASITTRAADRAMLLNVVSSMMASAALASDQGAAAAWALAMTTQADLTPDMVGDTMRTVTFFVNNAPVPLTASPRMAVSLTIASCVNALQKPTASIQSIVDRLALDALSDVETSSQCRSACQAPTTTGAFVLEAYRVDAFETCSSSCNVNLPVSLRSRYGGVPLGVVSTSWTDVGILSVNLYANGSTTPMSARNLSNPVTMVMPVPSRTMTVDNVQCMWFTPDHSSMNASGCTVVGPPIACACTHLTDFVLVERDMSASGFSPTLLNPVVALTFAFLSGVALIAALACTYLAPSLIVNAQALRSFRVMNVFIAGKSVLRLALIWSVSGRVPGVMNPYAVLTLAAMTQAIQFAIFVYLIALLATIWVGVEDMAGCFTQRNVAVLKFISSILKLSVFAVTVSPCPLLFVAYAFDIQPMATLAAAVVCVSTGMVALIIPITGRAIAKRLTAQSNAVERLSSRANSYKNIALFVSALTSSMGVVLLASTMLWAWSLAAPSSYNAQYDVAEPAFLALDAISVLLAIIYQVNILATQYRKAHQAAAPATMRRMPMNMMPMVPTDPPLERNVDAAAYRTRSRVHSSNVSTSFSALTHPASAEDDNHALMEDGADMRRTPWEDLLSEMSMTLVKKVKRVTEATGTTCATAPTGFQTFQQRSHVQKTFVYEALYDFVGDAQNSEMSFAVGDVFISFKDVGEGWGFARAADGRKGYIPRSYIRKVDNSSDVF